MTYPSMSRIFAAVSFSAILIASPSVLAQQGPAVPGISEGPAAVDDGASSTSGQRVDVPIEVLEAARNPELPGAIPLLRQYLSTGDGGPTGIARQAAAMFRAMNADRANIPVDELLRTVDHVTNTAIALLSDANVIRLGVDGSFRPRNTAVAWDFGPQGQGLHRGFDSVEPTSLNAQGEEVDGLSGPSESVLLSDGLVRILRVTVPVPLANGTYRIIPMSRNLSDPNQVHRPFGREVRINGVVYRIGQPRPQEWLDQAMLANGGFESAAVSGGPDGFRVRRFGDDARRMIARQQGAALILEGIAENGVLEIEFVTSGRQPIYLTGLLVEPINRLSNLIVSPLAANGIIPLNLRTALEQEILAAAASVLADIATAEGTPDSEQTLPDAIFDPNAQASPA